MRSETVTLPGSVRLDRMRDGDNRDSAEACRRKTSLPRRDDAGEKSVYAIISDGAHQYRVEEGQVFEVLRKDLPEGTETYEFDRILMIGDVEDGPRIGQPVVEGAKVTAAVVGEIKGDKLVIQKHRRRKNSSSKTGHRQKFLQVRVEKIEF